MINYFSQNAFILGILLVTFLCLSSVVFFILSYFFKIKVVEFGVFSRLWFVLHQKKISDIRFVLGWFPLNSHVKLLGWDASDDELKGLPEHELSNAVCNKRPYIKTLFQAVPKILVTVALLLSIHFVSSTGFMNNATVVGGVFQKAFKAMFSATEDRQHYVANLSLLLSTVNILAIGFLLCITYFFLYFPLSFFFRSLLPEEKWSLVVKISAGIVAFVGLWIALWKVPALLIFSLSLSQLLRYFVSILVGAFLAGFIYYGLTIAFASLLSLKARKNLMPEEKGASNRNTYASADMKEDKVQNFATTLKTFKPDFGLWASKNLNVDIHFFYNLPVKEIMRIGQEEYSLFLTYTFNKVEYALSLDFSAALLPDIVKSIAGYFSDEELQIVINRLIDPQYRFNLVEWEKAISAVSCEAVLGNLEVNGNEKYIPLKVKKFF